MLRLIRPATQSITIGTRNIIETLIVQATADAISITPPFNGALFMIIAPNRPTNDIANVTKFRIVNTNESSSKIRAMLSTEITVKLSPIASNAPIIPNVFAKFIVKTPFDKYIYPSYAYKLT